MRRQHDIHEGESLQVDRLVPTIPYDLSYRLAYSLNDLCALRLGRRGAKC